MNKTTRLLFIGAGLVLAFVAALFATGQEEQPVIKKKQIVVAVSDIWPGDTLTSDKIRTEKVLAEKVPEGAISVPSNVIGRTAAIPIFRNEMIVEDRLKAQNTIVQKDLYEKIPKGMRAVSLKIDEVTGISGLLESDDMVDVIAVSSIENGPPEKTARLILEQVKVLSIDTGGSGGKNVRNLRGTVTLLVTPAQVAALASAENARLILAARNSDDQARSNGILATWSLSDGADFSNGPVDSVEAGYAGLKDNMRGVTIPYSEKDGICGFLHPGHKVDIMAVTDKGSVATESPTPGAEGVFLKTETMSRIILEDVKIIAVTKNPQVSGGTKDPLDESGAGPDSEGTQGSGPSENKPVDEGRGNGGDAGQNTLETAKKAQALGTVTLLLSPENAEKVIMAGQASILRLLLRNSRDNETVESQGTKLVDLFFKSYKERIYDVEFYPGEGEGIIPFDRDVLEKGAGRFPDESSDRDQSPSPMI